MKQLGLERSDARLFQLQLVAESLGEAPHHLSFLGGPPACSCLEALMAWDSCGCVGR